MVFQPDSCCGNRPYNRNYLGCCQEDNGREQVFDIASHQCCGGLITEITFVCVM